MLNPRSGHFECNGVSPIDMRRNVLVIHLLASRCNVRFAHRARADHLPLSHHQEDRRRWHGCHLQSRRHKASPLRRALRQAARAVTCVGCTSRKCSIELPYLVMCQHYASPCIFCSQLCFSKSSCATRLNASAAAVLSRRGVVIPHGQREQHQPLKSSPSTRIRRLSINEPSICVEVKTWRLR